MSVEKDPEFVTWGGLDAEGSPTIGIILSRETAAQLKTDRTNPAATKALRVNVTAAVARLQAARMGDIYVQIVITDDFAGTKADLQRVGREQGATDASRRAN